MSSKVWDEIAYLWKSDFIPHFVMDECNWALLQSVPKTIELTGHLGQWLALIYWPKPGFTGPNKWHNTMSTKFTRANRASGKALFTGPIGNWLANGVGPVPISQTAVTMSSQQNNATDCLDLEICFNFKGHLSNQRKDTKFNQIE